MESGTFFTEYNAIDKTEPYGLVDLFNRHNVYDKKWQYVPTDSVYMWEMPVFSDSGKIVGKIVPVK
jgi:hypothetical protein